MPTKENYGHISKPIHSLVENPDFGRVIFHTWSYKESYNTRTEALILRKRCGYDIYTKSVSDTELHVIKRGSEDKTPIEVYLGV